MLKKHIKKEAELILKEKQLQIEKNKLLYTSYTNWEQDLGFLTLLITRATNTYKVFTISTYSEQLENNMMIKDEDIEDDVKTITENVYTSLSLNYVQFLGEKYFNSEKKLIEFIYDSVYMEVIKDATSANMKKITNNIAKSRSEAIFELNKSMEYIQDDK